MEIRTTSGDGLLERGNHSLVLGGLKADLCQIKGAASIGCINIPDKIRCTKYILSYRCSDSRRDTCRLKPFIQTQKSRTGRSSAVAYLLTRTGTASS
jgi:hypothetical protein